MTDLKHAYFGYELSFILKPFVEASFSDWNTP
jgi:hypothetical protein